ncbi:MAG: hypothetical protein LAT54_02335, partial [Cryomorphaceae bacterium]|nr:hypothetical protein [Cryomorphaceae bacterium]
MIKYIAPLLLFGSFVIAQSNWSDFFTDMHKWGGDTAVFFAQNGLFLNDTAANQIAIYRFSSAVDSATWRFSLGYD